MTRLLALMLAIALALTACGGSDGADDPDDAQGSDGSGDPTGSGDGSGEFSVAASLAELPVTGRDGAATISIADVAAVAEANGLELPATPADATAEWQRTMTGGDLDAGAALLPPATVFTLDQQAYAEATGFSWVQAETLANISILPDDFTVLRGSVADAEFGPAVEEIGDGLWSTGDREDYEQDIAGDRTVDQLGRSVRIARKDGAIATSLSTPMVQAWLSGDGPTLGDDEALSALAEQLDAAEAISAALVAGGSDSLAAGVGWLGDAQVVIVHDAGSESAADSYADALEEVYVDGRTTTSGQPISELLDVQDVTVEGRTVVVTAELLGSRLAPVHLVVDRSIPPPA